MGSLSTFTIEATTPPVTGYQPRTTIETYEVGGENEVIITYLSVSAQHDTRVPAYGRYVSGLLGGEYRTLSIAQEKKTTAHDLVKQAARDCDLVIFGGPNQSPWQRLLAGQTGRNLLTQVRTSLLSARQPRWPIRNILLIIRAEETDQAAIAWLGRLARPSGAVVTILAVVPSLPGLYHRGDHIQPGLDVLLAPNTCPGRQLHQVIHQLGQWHIEWTLRLRQGEPGWQIRQQVLEGDYDLVIIAAEPYSRWQRWLLGELVGPLLDWIDRPLLIAKKQFSDSCLAERFNAELASPVSSG